LKRILRNRFNIWLYRNLPVDWGIPLAKAVAGTSRFQKRRFPFDSPASLVGQVKRKPHPETTLVQTCEPKNERSPFYILMEWMERVSPSNTEEATRRSDGDDVGTSNYRIHVGIEKPKGSALYYWVVRAEQVRPWRRAEWKHLSNEHPVRFGEWMLVEAYFKKHRSKGRVFLAVDGEAILDTLYHRPKGFSGRTEHRTNPQPLKSWAVMKNYHDMRWNESGAVSQWYDNFELWSSFPPGYRLSVDE